MNDRDLDELERSLSRLLSILELSANYVRQTMKAIAQARGIEPKTIEGKEVKE